MAMDFLLMDKDFIEKYIYDSLESVDECIIDGEGCNFEISIISVFRHDYASKTQISNGNI